MQIFYDVSTKPLPKYELDVFKLISLIILVPIIEELIFRFTYYLFDYERMKSFKNIKVLETVFFNGLLFAIIHIPFGNMSISKATGIFNIFIFSMVLSYIFLKTDNLLYPIILHSFYNISSVIFNYNFKYFNENFGGYSYNTDLTIAISSILLLAISVFIFFKKYPGYRFTIPKVFIRKELDN